MYESQINILLVKKLINKLIIDNVVTVMMRKYKGEQSLNTIIFLNFVFPLTWNIHD